MNILKEISCHYGLLPGGTDSGTDDVQPSSSSVKETARILATELCCHDVLKTSSSVRKSRSNALHIRTMQTQVKELLGRHQIVFDKSVRSIAESSSQSESSSQRMDEGLERVLVEMFKDEQMNRGRVVAVYAIAQRLSQHAVDNGQTDMTEKIAEVTARFVEEHLCEWILNQGGWDSFEKQFQREDSVESKMWTGLLCTFIGLGTLATITALK